MMMMIVFIRTGDRAARENEITISAPSSLWSARARLGPTKTSADEPTTTTSRGCNYCNDQAEFKQEPPLQATTRVVSAAATRSVFARRSPRTEQEQQRSRVVLELKSSGARIQLPAPLGARRLGLLSLAEPISRDKQAIFVPAVRTARTVQRPIHVTTTTTIFMTHEAHATLSLAGGWLIREPG